MYIYIVQWYMNEYTIVHLRHHSALHHSLLAIQTNNAKFTTLLHNLLFIKENHVLFTVLVPNSLVHHLHTHNKMTAFKKARHPQAYHYLNIMLGTLYPQIQVLFPPPPLLALQD